MKRAARRKHRLIKSARRLSVEPLEDRRLLAVYSSGDIPKTINDNATVESTLLVADSVTIEDINVTLDISHNNDADLDVFLKAPDGTRVELFTDVGGGGNNFTATTLDDESSTPITSGSAPFSASYQPEGSLSDFDNANAEGTWSLEVGDDKNKGPSKGGGTLNSWSIDITPSGPALPSLSIDDVQLEEGDAGQQSIVFTVTRSGDLSGTSAADFATADGTATTADNDYVATSGTLNFAVNEASKTISVIVNGDLVIEAGETFVVNLTNPTQATIADSQGQGTILDDDGPSDPLFSGQWNLNNLGQSGGTVDADIDAVEAWATTTGSSSAVVAIIDNGVEYFHEDLYLNIWLNPGEIPAGLAGSLVDTDSDGIITFYDLNDPANASSTSDINGTGYIDAGDLLADPAWENGIDEDANGYLDDLVGWDFSDDDNDPYDPAIKHGTGQAGILGAIGDNGVGMTGVTWRVQMMALRMENVNIIRGVNSLNYAVAQGAAISNAAWGDNIYSQPMYDAIEAAEASGHLFVAAAHNQGTNNDDVPLYPASYDLNNIISVTTTDHNDVFMTHNYGEVSVDVSAPSSNIQATGIDSTYYLGCCTSAATPQVSGIAALLKTHYPTSTAAHIRDVIFGSVDLLPSLAGITSTGGRVNAASALQVTTIGADHLSVVEGNSGTTQFVVPVRWSGDTSQSITVDWSTIDGTATAGTDYVAAAGQLVFDNPAVNTQTITIDVFGDTAVELDETVLINLSITAGSGVLVHDQIVGTIESDELPIGTKFFVANDGSPDTTFEYDDSGTPLTSDNWNLNAANTVPLGATAKADGSVVWTIDSSDKVYAYDGDGADLGNWTAKKSSQNGNKGKIKTGEGIATDGSDIWIVDGVADVVYRSDGAASTATSGNVVPDSSFPLDSNNSSAKGITTDGTTIWVVDSGTDRVYRYDTTGSLLGDWPLDGGNSNASGITIDPNGSSTSAWVVDSVTDTVYEYDRDNGTFIDSFALAGGNGNPQGIADPLPWSGESDSTEASTQFGSSLLLVDLEMERRVQRLVDADPLIEAISEPAFTGWDVPNSRVWSGAVSSDEPYSRRQLEVDAALEDLEFDPLTDELLKALTDVD